MPIPDTLGWYSIPNTQLYDVREDPGETSDHFERVFYVWSGGCMDTLRNRLIIFGGGHGDRTTNEIYCYNLTGTPSCARLTNSCAGTDLNTVCDSSNPPQPTMFHTYNVIQYMTTLDRMFFFNRGWDFLWPAWTFYFVENTSQNQSPWYPWDPIQDYGGAVSPTWSSFYSPDTDKVSVTDGNYWWTFDWSANTLTRTGWVGMSPGYYATAVSPARNQVYIFGARWVDGAPVDVHVCDLTDGVPGDSTEWTTTGGSAIIGSQPGAAWDPITDQIVAWSGGNTVYTLNLDTKVWTGHTYSGGPGNAQDNGTFGRFQYSAPLGVFVLANHTNENLWSFRLNAATGDTEAPSAPTNLAANATSQSQIGLTWTASTDNVGVAGYLVERCWGTNCSNFAQIATPATNSYNDGSLTPATLYRYRVRAQDAAGNLSDYSDIAEDTTDAADTTPPTDPADLTPTVQSYSQIDLVWTASTDAVGVNRYEIERCVGAGCSNFLFFAVSYTNSYSNTGLIQNTTYRYRVRAFDAAGNASNYSNIATATTLASGVLQVGSAKTYTTLAAAIAVAVDGDVIECDAEIYQDDTCTITQNNLTVRGVGGYAHFRWDTGDNTTATTNIPNGQGIIKMLGRDVLFDRLEFSGAKVADSNGAGIRYNGGTFTVRRCYFHNNQEGILGQSDVSIQGPILTVEYSRFDACGYFDGVYYSHNIYIGDMPMFIFRYNETINPLDASHCFKSRARCNYLIANKFSTKDSDGSFEINFPNGHTAIVVDNVIEQGASSSNSTMIRYGEEGLTTGGEYGHELYIVNNTFYNWRSAGVTYIEVAGTPALIKAINNAYGPTAATFLSGSASEVVESNNINLTDNDWVDPANGDFHLVEGSSAIDAAIDPGRTSNATNFDLKPQYEYVDQADRKIRYIDATLDAGSYELGGNPPVRRVVMFKRPGT